MTKDEILTDIYLAISELGPRPLTGNDSDVDSAIVTLRELADKVRRGVWPRVKIELVREENVSYSLLRGRADNLVVGSLPRIALEIEHEDRKITGDVINCVMTLKP
jgi:hypothetical protein